LSFLKIRTDRRQKSISVEFSFDTVFAFKHHVSAAYIDHYYYYYYLLQLSFRSVVVVLTLVQIKQIRINIHKRNNTKIQYKKYTTQYIQIHILPKHPHNCQNTPTYAYPHIKKKVKTTTVQDTYQMK